MSTVPWHYEHRITVISQQSQKLIHFSTNTIKLHNSTTNNNFENKIISDMHHRTTYMHNNFSRIGLVDQLKRAHKFICKKMQIAQICNLQLEFRKITLFGHAPPPNGHSGRF